MAEWQGNDTTTWIFPDGDYITSDVFRIDTSRWTMADFIALDNCPPAERIGLAKVIGAIRATEQMSVVEITIKR